MEGECVREGAAEEEWENDADADCAREGVGVAVLAAVPEPVELPEGDTVGVLDALKLPVAAAPLPLAAALMVAP
jgi:hypothetical protein